MFIGLNRALKIIKTSKKHDQVVGLIASYFHLNSKTYANGFDKTIFDNPQVQKYLNFITNENARHISESNLHKDITALMDQKKELEKEFENLKNMSSEGDQELEKLIETEKQQCLDKIEKIKTDLLSCMFLENKNDNRNVELQIISGVGGEEAKLFRSELLQMYINYATYKNWECVHDSGTDYLLISGESVFGHLKHEGGVHRVQRVPETEKQNRVHTSTCSVVILPQPKPHEIVINEKDLIIEKMRSSGPGGQNVNKTESCIRIKHIPTGIVIENQTSRFQFENKKLAIERLRRTLFNIEQNKIKTERSNLIKDQAGTNDYADKIRTYNFPQNRITDHRLNYSLYNMKSFLSGTKDLDVMIKKLREFQKINDFFEQIQMTMQTKEYKNFEKNQMN